MADTIYIPVNKRLIGVASPAVQYETSPTATGQNTTSYSVESSTIQVCSYGQSLSVGFQGVPILTTEPLFNSNLMLGDCVRRSNMQGTNYIPTGDGLLKPMLASAQPSGNGGGGVISNEAANNLPLGTSAAGEDLVVSAANTFKHMLNIRRGMKDEDSVRLIATSAGNSGRSIEALSKGSPTRYYDALTDSVAKSRAQSGESHPVAALLWTQGEQNYGEGTSKESYKTSLKKLHQDFISDACLDQSLKPALFMYQTGGAYTRDGGDLAIGMAQLELGLYEDNMYLATPSYQYPDHGGHLTSNGYRWMGCQYGKVMDIVINKREQWKPTHMVKASAKGNFIYVTIYAPVPPLQIKPCFNKFDLVQYDNCGFTVKSGGQTINVTQCEVVGPTTLKLECSSPVKAGDMLWYAEKTLNNGNGNICDSDTTVAIHNYEYMELPTMSTKENLPEFVDKPYPLENWLCAAVIEIE